MSQMCIFLQSIIAWNWFFHRQPPETNCPLLALPLTGPVAGERFKIPIIIHYVPSYSILFHHIPSYSHIWYLSRAPEAVPVVKTVMWEISPHDWLSCGEIWTISAHEKCGAKLVLYVMCCIIWYYPHPLRWLHGPAISLTTINHLLCTGNRKEEQILT